MSEAGWHYTGIQMGRIDRGTYFSRAVDDFLHTVLNMRVSYPPNAKTYYPSISYILLGLLVVQSGPDL